MKKIILFAALVMAIALIDNLNTNSTPSALPTVVGGVEAADANGSVPSEVAVAVPSPAYIREDD